MKKLLLLVITCISASCSNQIDFNEKIKGNWHSGIEPDPMGVFDSISTKEQINYRYTEYFFSDQYAYTYTDLAAEIPPNEYRIKGDSLYFYYDIKEAPIFGGVINIKNDSVLKITIDKHNTLFYRLKENEKTLSNFVVSDSKKNVNRFKKSINFFGPLFQERFNQKFEEYSKKNN